jgi:hypothetical protein
MPLIVPDAGELFLLDTLLKKALSATSEAQILKLYTNNVTPNSTFVAASLTEATFTGYAARTLTRSVWNAAVSVSNKAESSYGTTPQSWTCGSTGQTVNGYYVQSNGSGSQVLWAELFTTPRTLASGDILNITPKFTLFSEN